MPAMNFDLLSVAAACHARTDFPDPLSPLVFIVHRFREVYQATSRISIELL